MIIKLDLKNRPAAPFDFPHQCFTLSWRLKAAWDALTGAEPWENHESDPSTRVVALHALVDLIREVKALIKPSADSPYDAAIGAVLAEKTVSWKQNQRGIRDFWPEWDHWVESINAPSKDITRLDLSKLEVELDQLKRRLEVMGLYFLRMFQARGRCLPDELEIEVDPATRTGLPDFGDPKEAVELSESLR